MGNMCGPFSFIHTLKVEQSAGILKQVPVEMDPRHCTYSLHNLKVRKQSLVDGCAWVCKPEKYT